MRKMRYMALLCLLLNAAQLRAEDSASLQFSVAAPDPVMAGETVKFQTLAVNTGSTRWEKGSYYWVAEVYTIEGEEPKFLAQTEPITPVEAVPGGGASGVQLPFQVPDNFSGRRLLYKVMLIKDGRRLLETDYRGFQVIEKKFAPPVPQDFKAGGDVSVTYKNSSKSDWTKHQFLTSANIVGKVKRASFLFNTYLIHTYSKPVTPNIILFSLYAPWGNLSAGDIAPSLTPLSLDGQGMRGLAYERQKEKWSGSLLVGRIVAPQEPTANFSGRFATYTGGGKVSYNLRRNLKLTFDSALSKDDAFSITIDTAANTLKARQNFVYGGSLEWKALKSVTFSSEYQMSSYRADLQASEPAVSGSGYRHEIKYRSGLLGLKGRLSRVDPDFWSLASPATIHDRLTYDAEAGIYPADWVSVSAGYNRYTDNLDKVPGNTTTTQTQMSVSPTVRLFGSTMLTGSMLTNTALGKPAAVQDNQTKTMSFSVMQPVKAHTLNASMQTSDFKDNTGLSHNLNSSLMSFSGAFRLSPRLSFSSGLVNSDTKDKADSSSSQSNSITGNVTYAMPRRSLAVQLWSTISTNKNDSVSYPSDTRSMNMNFETIWLKSQNSKLTFGVGRNTVTDNLNEDNSTSEYTFLTRYNYSF